MTSYVEALNALKAKAVHLPKEIKDQWRTPDWLYFALNELYGPFVLDLFTDGQNAKCERFYTAEDNALTQDWAARLRTIAEDGDSQFCDACGIYHAPVESERCPFLVKPGAFANPPYSPTRTRKGEAPLTGMKHMIAKAAAERDRGAETTWLIKSATSESWWPNKEANKIIFIKGRIGFEPPVWFRPKEGTTPPSGAGFGAAIAKFVPGGAFYPHDYISREELFEIGAPLAKVNAADRDKWFKLWDEV